MCVEVAGTLDSVEFKLFVDEHRDDVLRLILCMGLFESKNRRGKFDGVCVGIDDAQVEREVTFPRLRSALRLCRISRHSAAMSVDRHPRTNLSIVDRRSEYFVGDVDPRG